MREYRQAYAVYQFLGYSDPARFSGLRENPAMSSAIKV